MSDPMLRLARGAGARARVGNAAGRAIVLLLPAISFAVCVHSNAGSLRRAPPPFPLLAPGRFPLLQAAAPRTGPEPWGATAIGRLRGGFDVWGDDEEDDTVAAGGARGGERMSAVGVREAAKKAAAAAAAFKAAKTAAAGCGAARKDQEPGTSAVVSTGPAAEAKDAEADVDAELAMLMARQKMAMEADKKGATSSDHDGKHDGKRRAGEDGGYQGTYQGGEDCTEQGSQEGGGENEEEDVDQESEDFDGYDDLGWGGQQPLLGKDIAELVDGSDFDDEGWVDHLSSSEHAPDDTFATAETTANSLSATAHSVSADGKASARGVAGMGSVKGEGRNQGRERGSSPSPVDKDSRAEEDVKAARVGEEELQNEQQVFYPHPMWIRKELLEAYVEPYLEDGRLRGGIKGALRNLKKLLEAGAVTDAQFKARKTLLKKRDKGQTTDDEAGGLVGKDSPEAAEAGSETDDTDVKNVPKTSTSKQSQGRGQAKGGREGTMNELVPLDQIVLPKAGACSRYTQRSWCSDSSSGSDFLLFVSFAACLSVCMHAVCLKIVCACGEQARADDGLVCSWAGVCAMDGSQDQHYRYKMPVLQVKVEGTTKMIRTVLTNIEQVPAVSAPCVLPSLEILVAVKKCLH